MATYRRKRGTATLSVNQRESFWKDLVLQASGGTKEEPVTEKEMLTAQRIVADRLFPKLKPVSQPITLELPKNADIDVMCKTLLEGAITGKCDPEVANSLISSIANVYSVKANNEIAERFKQMEDEFTEFMRWKVTQNGGDEVTHNL